MKKLNNFQSENNNQIIVVSAIITAFFITHPAYAKLDKAAKALGDLKTDLISNIIPIAAAVILLCLAIGYAGRYIGKDTFVRWAVGVVIAGSATELATLLFTGKS
ncbi:VirB2 family type IV secretion system major pilin TrwL [Bartonella sp. ML70XJBT.G]|uniref:VirB2 family type IV secretion system major pilin TrwL n=1 Tax=Bartonella sp. ML70XJBT.G TaxID=3019093 RepID=UPI00235E061C|nr:VirB2 family type IV secretion system major pilin TrwL [Bartonella sp. ML70XJBT.G]